MAQSAVAVVAHLGAHRFGIFRGRDAVAAGVSRRQLDTLRETGVIARELPDTFRLTAVRRCAEQRLWAALLWAGDEAAACACSAGAQYGLEGVMAPSPEIAVPQGFRGRAPGVRLHRASDMSALMVRTVRGMRIAGVEATLLQLAHRLDDEGLEAACEHARRCRLTSMAALEAYLLRYAKPGRRGSAALRELLAELDPAHPSKSRLEVKARRLLVAHGFTNFVREHPLAGATRTYYFDFAFNGERTIFETNGRRWHDDPSDYEHDNEKWSVPGRHGYKLVLATWDKVTQRPDALIEELVATLNA